MKFLRPVTVDSGLLTCEGTVIQRGRRTALAQAELTDEAGKVVAHATSSCMIFQPPRAEPGSADAPTSPAAAPGAGSGSPAR